MGYSTWLAIRPHYRSTRFEVKSASLPCKIRKVQSPEVSKGTVRVFPPGFIVELLAKMPASKRPDDELERMIAARKKRNRERELAEINDFISIVTRVYASAGAVDRLGVDLKNNDKKRRKKNLREMR